MGCPVCGYGVDWTWYPSFYAVEGGTWLSCFEIGWMRYEYLCAECWKWAHDAGAKWDGKVEFKFEGFNNHYGKGRGGDGMRYDWFTSGRCKLHMPDDELEVE